MSPLMKSRDQQAVEHILAELQLDYRFFDCFQRQHGARITWFVSKHEGRASPDPPKFKHWTVQKMMADDYHESEQERYKECLKMIYGSRKLN